jgi:hypothetical protein
MNGELRVYPSGLVTQQIPHRSEGAGVKPAVQDVG